MIFVLIAYIIFLIGFLIYSVMGIYHLWRFGYVGDLTKPAIVIYSVLASIIIIISIILIAFEKWPMDFSLWSDKELRINFNSESI